MVDVDHGVAVGEMGGGGGGGGAVRGGEVEDRLHWKGFCLVMKRKNLFHQKSQMKEKMTWAVDKSSRFLQAR